MPEIEKPDIGHLATARAASALVSDAAASPSDWFAALPDYPVSKIFAAFSARDIEKPLLLEAEPGAGKSTLAPLWLLREAEATGCSGTIYLVQPRILAAQTLAARLAALTQTPLGERVGFWVPHRSRLSPTTQLIVTTPGLLLQKLLQDPEATGIHAIILDEIHERSVNQDLLLALVQEVQLLNESLQLLLMTATPDPKLRSAIGQRLHAEGFCYPVAVRYLPPAASKTPGQFEREQLPALVGEALASVDLIDQQTVLVFLPGWSAIEAVAGFLVSRFADLAVHRLHSRVDAREQARALDDSAGSRVILSTNIAETSLTIKDVTLVIDAGLMRRQSFEQKTQVGRLRTGRISQASAEQRAGRAGRVQAGTCIRLWAKDERLAAADLPELRACDYLPLALKLAHWGAPPESLPWLEAPNPLALAQAFASLRQWQFVETAAGGYRITARGRRASELGTHPRVAALLIEIAEAPGDAINTSALLLIAVMLHMEQSVDNDADAWFAAGARSLAQQSIWQQQFERWTRQLQLPNLRHDGAGKWRVSVNVDEFNPHDMACLARAFVDRLGVRQASGRYGLANGASFTCQATSEFTLALTLTSQRDSLVAVALPVDLDAALRELLVTRRRETEFKAGRWHWRERECLGARVLTERTLPADGELLAAVVSEILRQLHGRLERENFLDIVNADAAQLLGKARLLAGRNLIDAPALSDDALIESLAHWLGPFISETSAPAHLPWRQALEFYVGYEAVAAIGQLLPDRLTLPSGRSVAVEFNSDGEVCVAAKLQEFFGCESLEFAGGKLPVKISLLSPNGSPLAVTSNLKTFWQNAYAQVRKDMRGRYPRHPWPENPLEHAATALTKRKLAQQPPNS